MGIDYYSCDYCGDSFPDVISYFVCDECSKVLCEECKDKLLGWDEEAEEDICPFCVGNVVSDADLLEFAMKKLGVTREELAQACLEWRGIDEQEK